VNDSDIATLLSCLADVSHGDAVAGDTEGVDSHFLQALRMAQFSTQYIQSTSELLVGKKKLLKNGEFLPHPFSPVKYFFHTLITYEIFSTIFLFAALQTFSDEEDKLDLEIAKLTSRNKSLLKEVGALDDLSAQYKDLLMALDPVQRHAVCF